MDASFSIRKNFKWKENGKQTVKGSQKSSPQKIINADCCDMGQNDTIGKIELNPSFVLSSDNTNYKNDIQ